jgi:prepilin-type N-terminal cleavage/methylation domain-containing protein
MRRACSRLTSTKGHGGFTLPEILIVIVMISVLALVAIPRFAVANGRRHMESARMRIATSLATARAAAIQKGEPVRFQIVSNRVMVRTAANWSTAQDLVSPVPLDTLYNVKASWLPVGDSLKLDFSSRGFATYGQRVMIILQRPGVDDDTVVVTKTGWLRQ